MGRRKKSADSEQDVKAREFDLVDGPRGGTKIRLKNPPPPFLRLAFPEWCTYEFKQGSFFYIGNEPVPQDVYRDW